MLDYSLGSKPGLSLQDVSDVVVWYTRGSFSYSPHVHHGADLTQQYCINSRGSHGGTLVSHISYVAHTGRGSEPHLMGPYRHHAVFSGDIELLDDDDI